MHAVECFAMDLLRKHQARSLLGSHCQWVWDLS
ncbi:hypothetical protein LINGRAHAP2_LOCUS31762 [Linum grandiflorum]